MVRVLLNRLMIIGGALCLVGCAGTTFNTHDEKHKDLSLEALLSDENLSSEDRKLFENSLVKRATLKSENGEHASAVRHARMALKLSPEDIDVKYLLAEALFGAGQFEESEQIFSEIAIDGANPEVFQGYGLALFARNKPDEAVNWLNRAVIADTSLWRAWNGLGVIYDKSESWKLAEQAFKAGIAVNGQNASINNNLGISYLKQKKLTQAIIAFENVQVLPGGKKLSDMNYRTALALNGNMDKAKNGATDLQLAQLYNNLGVISINDGKPEAAIAYLKKAIATNPSYYANAAKNLEIAKSALP